MNDVLEVEPEVFRFTKLFLSCLLTDGESSSGDE